MRSVLNYSQWRVNRIMEKLPYLCMSLTYDQLMAKFLTIYFSQVRLTPIVCGAPAPDAKIDECTFVKRIREACYFVPYKPDEKLLRTIFAELSGCRGYLRWWEYVRFIKLSLVNVEEEEPKVCDCQCGPHTKAFTKRVWRALEREFANAKTWCQCRQSKMTYSELFRWMSYKFGWSYG